MLSVGEILKQERVQQKIDISKIEKQIRIRAKFLQAIEENNWKIFSSKIYISGIIKNYSQFLGLDSKKLLAVFRRDYEKQEEVKFKRKITDNYLSPETKRLVTIGLGIIFLLFFSYFGFQLKQYLTPPKIIILSPLDNRFKKENKIKIIGKADKEAMINIFGDRVYQNREGFFEYDLPLKKGRNELIIEAVGANGKKSAVKRVYFKE